MSTERRLRAASFQENKYYVIHVTCTLSHLLCCDRQLYFAGRGSSHRSWPLGPVYGDKRAPRFL